MSDLIADQIKAYKTWYLRPIDDPIEGHNHVMRILESIRIELSQQVNFDTLLNTKIDAHEALLLHQFGTLDLEYHKRSDEILVAFQRKVDEDAEKTFLTPDERSVRVNRFGREAREAKQELDDEYGIKPIDEMVEE